MEDTAARKTFGLGRVPGAASLLLLQFGDAAGKGIQLGHELINATVLLQNQLLHEGMVAR